MSFGVPATRSGGKVGLWVAVGPLLAPPRRCNSVSSLSSTLSVPRSDSDADLKHHFLKTHSWIFNFSWIWLRTDVFICVVLRWINVVPVKFVGSRRIVLSWSRNSASSSAKGSGV